MIVVFDSTCLLCDRSVRFLLRHDRRQRLRFASMQGVVGGRLLADAGLQIDRLQSMLVVDGQRTWENSAALLKLLAVLGWPWRLGLVAWLVPAPLRDALYRWIARNRYAWFGRSPICLMPPADHAARFLD